MASAFLRITVVLAALAAAALLPARASGASGLVVGLADDGLKYEPQLSAARYRELGVSAVRLTVTWRGETELGGAEASWVDRAVAAAGPRVRVVLSVYGKAALTPVDEAGRNRYCAFVRNALARYPGIRDVVVWNEVNKSHFWRPQFDDAGASAAPAAYAALLARCWDVLHTFRPDVNLLTSTSSRGNDNPNAKSNVSHSPGAFIRKLGEAYRDMKRPRPIFDTVGHHPYGESSAERPWRRHPLSTTIAQGDWDKLVQAYHDAFAGTEQPNPGRCAAGRCAAIWYMEIGYQTTVAEHAGPYHGVETDERAVPSDGPGDPPGSLPVESSQAPDHGTQLAEAIRLAACQPYVGAYFNFHLRDEADLDRWQSGVYWADWAPKASAHALAAAVAEVRAGSVDCNRVARLVLTSGAASAPGGRASTQAGGLSGAAAGAQAGASSASAFPAPRTDVAVLRVAWPAARRFNWRHDEWRFRVAAGETVRYTAVLRRVQPAKAVVRTKGRLRFGYFSFVTFPRKRLIPGATYRIEIVLTSEAAPDRSTRLLSPPLHIRLRPSS